MKLRCLILAHDPLDASLVLDAVLLEEVVRLGLCWRFRVGVVQQVLHAEKNRLDRDGWLPRLLLIQDGKTDGT